jgi:hypothetical protein
MIGSIRQGSCEDLDFEMRAEALNPPIPRGTYDFILEVDPAPRRFPTEPVAGNSGTLIVDLIRH